MALTARRLIRITLWCCLAYLLALLVLATFWLGADTPLGLAVPFVIALVVVLLVVGWALRAMDRRVRLELERLGAFAAPPSLSSSAAETETGGAGSNPFPIYDLTITPGHDGLLLTWTNPPGDFARVRVFRSLKGFAPAPIGGVNQALVYEGPDGSFEDLGVERGELCYYTAFARSLSGDWSRPVTATAVGARPSAAQGLVRFLWRFRANASVFGNND